MPRFVEDLGVYLLLAAVWIGVPAYVLYRAWWLRLKHREDLEGTN